MLWSTCMANPLQERLLLFLKVRLEVLNPGLMLMEFVVQHLGLG
jgi:hypothetical protein